jgi:hypothetical protein
MRNLLRYGGVVASVILIAVGIGAIVIGANGRSEVGTQLKREAIVGTPDMTPAAIAKEANAAGLKNVSLPTCSVAGKSIDTGGEAKCFASYMRIHALEATGGQTYAQMPRYQGPNGTFTNDEAKAVKGPNGKPVDNPVRNLWVTETALTTALNTSYFAQSVAVFSIVMGIALLLTGIGFLLLSTGLLSAGALTLPHLRRSGPGATPAAPAAS